MRLEPSGCSTEMTVLSGTAVVPGGLEGNLLAAAGCPTQGRAGGALLGPQPTGKPRTTAGSSGNRTLVRPAGRCTYSPLTW